MALIKSRIFFIEIKKPTYKFYFLNICCADASTFNLYT